MDIRIPDASRAKEFRRRASRINQPPESASILECKGAIELGLSGNVNGRKLKDQANIVNNWVQNNDESALGQGVKPELTRRFEVVHEKWRFFQYTRFTGLASICSKEFQTATRDFLEYARANLQFSNEPLIAPTSETIESPKMQNEPKTSTAIVSSEFTPKQESEVATSVDQKPATSQGASDASGIVLNLEQDAETKEVSAELDQLKAIITDIVEEMESGIQEASRLSASQP